MTYEERIKHDIPSLSTYGHGYSNQLKNYNSKIAISEANQNDFIANLENSKNYAIIKDLKKYKIMRMNESVDHAKKLDNLSKTDSNFYKNKNTSFKLPNLKLSKEFVKNTNNENINEKDDKWIAPIKIYENYEKVKKTKSRIK